MPVPVVLASASPVRRQLLGQLLAQFDVLPADIPEERRGESCPEALTVRLACEKAQAVHNQRPDALVIAADTVAFCDGELIGKPADRNDAVRILTKLTRGDHRVVTGLCMAAPDGRLRTEAVSTTITMVRLPQERIVELAHLPGALEAAGAYRLQPDDPNVARIEGSETNVMGLPLETVRSLMENLYPREDRT